MQTFISYVLVPFTQISTSVVDGKCLVEEEGKCSGRCKEGKCSGRCKEGKCSGRCKEGKGYVRGLRCC